jgi:hypothetical protein
MRATRKLFLVGALALAALAMMASSAPAVTILQEPGNTACDPGPNLNSHVVTGGCHIHFNDGDGVRFLFHTGAAEITFGGCAMTFEVRLDSAGNGWATNQVFSDPPGDPVGTCTRRPCDETNMEKLAWPLNIGATSTLETVLCVRTVASGEGGAQTFCHVILPISGSGHAYTVGVPGTEYSCVQLPLEISDVELTAGAERIEIRP